MNPRLICLLVIAALNPLGAFAASLDKEYDQVRMIALRDPKVKAAFDRANQRLEDKIVEIDPALKGYVKGQSNASRWPSSRGRFTRPAKAVSGPVQTHRSSRRRCLHACHCHR